MHKFKTLFVLVIIFLLSVIVRTPYINNVVPNNNQGHIIVLTTLENWKVRGLSECYFSPIQTWNNDGDRFISNYVRLEDKKGNNYFVSYPSFTFLFAHFIFTVSQIYPNQLTLLLINLLLHFISGLLIYLIIQNYYNKKWQKIFIPGLLGFITFCFFPPTLFYSLNYFPEMMALPIWLTGIFLFIKYINLSGRIKTRQLFLFGLIIFLMAYTEWIALFFSFTVAVICFFKRNENKNYVYLLYTTILSSVASISLTIFQYGRINGLYNLARGMGLRFLERSGLFGDKYADQQLSIVNHESYAVLFKHLHYSFMGFGYLLLIALFILFLVSKRKININISKKGKLILLLMIVPVLLHFVLFFNGNILHFGGMAKLGVPVSLLFAIVIYKLSHHISLHYKKIYHIILAVAIICAIAVSVFSFERFMQSRVDKRDFSEQIKTIKDNSQREEAIFINSKSVSSYDAVYLSYLCKRNMMRIDNISDAEKILKEKNKTNGVFITFAQNKNDYVIEHVEVH